MSDPTLRRAIEAVRDHDRPEGVDREALLKKILASTQSQPPAAPAVAKPVWPFIAGAVTVILVGALAWRAKSSSHHDRPQPPAVQTQPVVQAPPVVQTPPAVQAQPVAQTQPVVQAPPTPQPSIVTPPRTALPSRTVIDSSAHRAAVDADEWRILREADTALQAHDAERALSILARHTAEHPRGVAGPEVMAYRVRALCMANRVDEAVETARALRTRAPDSPAAYSLRATCVSGR